MKKVWVRIDRVIYFVLYKLLRCHYDQRQWEWISQFVRFALVGIINTMVSYGCYLIFWKLGIHYLVANILGYFMGIVNSFFWNNRYVFVERQSGKRRLLRTFFRTCCSYIGVGFVVENVLLVIAVQILQIHETVAPFIAAVLIVPINFIINKLWAYREG